MFDDIESALKGHLKDVADWRKKTRELQQQIAKLERAGVVEATAHYKDGKYLYLIHPMKQGERVREYIGADEKAKAAALAKIARWSQREGLKAQLAKIEKQATQLSEALAYATRRLW